MPRRSKADSEATALAILDAAVVHFGKDGYAAVRLDDVARTAGVTRGAVYHHYKDKPRLFHAVLEQVQAQVGDAVAEAADAVGEAWESFRTGCRAFISVSLDPAHRRIMLIDAPAVVGWDAWRALDEKHASSHLHAALTDLQAARLIDVPSVDAAASMLSGAMNEAAMWVAEQPGPEALSDAYEMLDLLMGSIRRQV